MKITRRYILMIDSETLVKYNRYYFNEYPKRKKEPIQSTIPPSLNQWMIMPRMQMNATKQKWKEFGIWLVNFYGCTNLKIEKARVTYIYYFPTRARHDADNYNCKFLGDALVQSGMLVDDDFKHIEVTYRGFYSKENPRTEIIIEPID